MPWCPKCKNEYRVGFTTCSECNLPLVDEIDTTTYYPICTFSNDITANRVKDYLDYSGIKYKYDAYGDENAYYILTDADNRHKADQAVKAFLNVEDGFMAKVQIDSSYYIARVADVKAAMMDSLNDPSALDVFDDNFDKVENPENFTEEEKEEIVNELNKRVTRPSTIYQSKSYKAEELSGSAYILIGFGVVGLAFVILNWIGVLNIIQLNIPSVAMLLMFAAFLVGGIYSFISYKKTAVEAVEEKKFTDEVNKWFDTCIDPNEINRISVAGNTDEENYLVKVEYLKGKLKDQFPSIEDDFADAMIEDYYTRTFE